MILKVTRARKHISMDIVTCLACGGDGSLLVCNEKGCGFAVHEKCLPCSAYYDASGNFYCPQCSYELAVEECIQAKRHASLAKQALLKFISDQQPEVEVTNGKQPSHSTSARDACHLTQAGGVLENPGLTDKCHETETGDVIGLPSVSFATSRKRHTDEMLEESSGKDELFVDDSDISDSDNGTTLHKNVKIRRLQNGKRAKSGQQSSRDADFQNGNADEIMKQRQDRDLSSLSSLTRKFLNSDKRGTTKTRPRKQWSDAEVEILKEGVQRFSVRNSKMPWGRILEYGSRVFQHYRTAVDLKDKWRNLTK